jgi:PBP1b-binding outer membrane lipoprotein LpoB
MQKIKLVIMLAVAAVLLSSCHASHSALSRNENVNTTQVVLAKKNYKVLEKIEGTATTVSVFGLGNHGMKTLVSNARADMLSKVNFIGGSKAIINENIEINNRTIFMVSTKSVNVSAYLIEFTE